MSMVEIIPIGTILAVITQQVIKTANAATDVVFEKESFKVLAKHLFDIETVLKELEHRELNDSQAARIALESLENDIKKANNLIESCKNWSRFYLFLKCRHIVEEIQHVTRDIGRSLDSLNLANAEVSTRISEEVRRLQNEMQRSEFETSYNQGQILDRLNHGLSANKLDQAFANDMLEQIAMAVGVPIVRSEIIRELDDFRRAKEDAALKKEKSEEFFLGQVIELLSRADAARDYEEVRRQYEHRVQTMERYHWKEAYIRPLDSFHCRITKKVMVDPVSLCTGTTCEREAIMARFESGDRTDPDTLKVLEDISLFRNIPLRQSIEEWREMQYCLKIRSLRENLLSEVDKSIEEALTQMQDLMLLNSINKDWMSIEGFTEIVVSILVTIQDRDVERKILITLKDFVEGHTRNKEELVESRGWNHIILCLGRDSSFSEVAIKLLYELLQGQSGWNESVCRKLSQDSRSIPYLVSMLQNSEQESAQIADNIFVKLLELDEKNYSRAAKAGWLKPLVDRILEGPETSRTSMVKAFITMELDDSKLKLLGEKGIIPALIEMASGNFESKEQSLSALAKLACCHANRSLIAEAGGVRLVVSLMFSPNARMVIVVRCCEILEKMASGDDAVGFFVDERGAQLELESIVTNLLQLLQIPNSAHNVRKPSMKTLLGICKFESSLVKKAVITIKDLSPILQLLDDRDSEIREIAIKLLVLFSDQEQEGIVNYFLKPRRVEVLVGFLENEGRDDMKLAAAQLLVNLPKSATQLTKALIEPGGHIALISMLKTGTMEAKEIALSALFRFTDPESLDSQRVIVGAGIYPLLLNSLRAGSINAKARSAGLIGNLSSNSQKLTDVSDSRCCWCFRPKGVPLCAAHGGVCGVASSFCLLEADVLTSLVSLLREKDPETAEEAIIALSTLVNENAPSRGANVLHQADAIRPVLDVLLWGTMRLKEKALELLEKVFKSKEIAQNYASSARFVLADLTGSQVHSDCRVTSKAAKILALIDRSSRSFLSWNSG